MAFPRPWAQIVAAQGALWRHQEVEIPSSQPSGCPSADKLHTSLYDLKHCQLSRNCPVAPIVSRSDEVDALP